MYLGGGNANCLIGGALALVVSWVDWCVDIVDNRSSSESCVVVFLRLVACSCRTSI